MNKKETCYRVFIEVLTIKLLESFIKKGLGVKETFLVLVKFIKGFYQWYIKTSKEEYSDLERENIKNNCVSEINNLIKEIS